MALVCHCRCINDRVVRTAALAAGGDLDATQAICGAGLDCGGCIDAVEALNDVLTAELTAVNQYFIHAKMSSNWGYLRRGAHVRDESIDEMRHAERIIDRVLYFDGTPNMQRLFPVRVGETVAEQLELDLAVEHEAVPRLNRAIEPVSYTHLTLPTKA